MISRMGFSQSTALSKNKFMRELMMISLTPWILKESTISKLKQITFLKIWRETKISYDQEGGNSITVSSEGKKTESGFHNFVSKEKRKSFFKAQERKRNKRTIETKKAKDAKIIDLAIENYCGNNFDEFIAWSCKLSWAKTQKRLPVRDTFHDFRICFRIDSTFTP